MTAQRPYWRCLTNRGHRHRNAVDAIACSDRHGRWWTVVSLELNREVYEHPGTITYMSPFGDDPAACGDAAREAQHEVVRQDVAWARRYRYLLGIGVRGGARFG